MSSIEYDSGIDPMTGLPKAKGPKKPPPSFGPPDPWQYAQGLVDPYTPGPSSLPKPGGSIPIPGLQPDYASLIQNDPLFLQMQKDLKAQGVSDAASRAAMTQRALIGFGQVPQFDGLSGLNPEWLNQDVSEQTRQLAQQNTDAGLSMAARQQKAFQDQLKAIRNALAARGALRSGEAGYAFQEAQIGFDQAKYDTTQQLIDFIAGLQAGFTQAEQGRQGQLGQGAQDAAGRVPTQPTAPTPAAPLLPTPPPVESVEDMLDQLVKKGRNGGGGGNYVVL